MRIQNNLAAVNSHRVLTVNNNNKAKTSEKLSSGYRVNRAANDAAGLAISEKLRAQIRGLAQASRNIADGVSLLQLGDGGLQGITDMVHRMRELAVQAASDTNELLDRQAIQMEIADLTSEINCAAGNTEFNTIKLFDGSMMGTHMWNYGIKDEPMISPKDPAQIFAIDEFSEVRIPRGSQARQTVNAATGSATSPPYTSIGSSHLQYLDGPPPQYPQEGEFIIRITDPGFAPGGANIILNFAVENADGNFTSADFQQFFQNAFDAAFGTPGTPPYQGATITVNNGQINVQTHGLGGSSSEVIIGATNYNPGVNRPSGTVFVNSSIFGASVNSSTVFDNYRVTTGDTVSPAQLSEINAIGHQNSALVWDLIPDSTVFSWQLQEWQYNPTWGPPSSPYSYSFLQSIHTISMTKAELMAGYQAANGAPPENFAQANAYLATQGDGVYFTSLTLSTPRLYVDRAGVAFINFTPTGGRTYNDPNLPYRYQIAGGPPTMSRNNDAHYVSERVTSTYPARIPEKNGLLTINISGVPTSTTTTTTRSITVDFSDPMWTSASTPQDLVNYINAQINNPAFWPVPPPVYTNAAYNPSMPVAVASLDARGHLVITGAERSFSVSVQERLSDKPMYLNARYENIGTDWSPTINIKNNSGATIASVPIVGSDYSTLDEFIRANQSAFRSRGFILSSEDERLVITSIAGGDDVTVEGIDIGGGGGHDWQSVLGHLGLKDLPPENFIDGVTYPPEPIGDRSLWIQSGANNEQGVYIGIPRLDAQDLGLMLTARDLANPGAYSGISTALGTSQYTGTANVQLTGTSTMGHSLDVTTHEKASAALDILDNALYIVSEERARFGAMTNRLEYERANVDNSHENQSAAESRIRDAEMALEHMKFVKEQILTQSATAMLAQANALPQTILQLIG